MLRFLGIGAQKACTSWLYEQLRQHPDLRFPRGKELHFWNRPHDPASVAAYLKHFGPPETCAGEMTPAYAILPGDTIAEIRQLLPDTRLLYLLRNPIDRAWSSALMALRLAEMTPLEASDQWFLDHFHSVGSWRRGHYLACLRAWWACFPADQLLVETCEAVISEPEALLNRCFAHLGVPPLPAERLREQGCRQKVFQGTGHPLRPSLRPALIALYAESIHQLGAELGQDFSHWLE